MYHASQYIALKSEKRKEKKRKRHREEKHMTFSSEWRNHTPFSAPRTPWHHWSQGHRFLSTAPWGAPPQSPGRFHWVHMSTESSPVGEQWHGSHRAPGDPSAASGVWLWPRCRTTTSVSLSLVTHGAWQLSGSQRGQRRAALWGNEIWQSPETRLTVLSSGWRKGHC